MSFFSQSISESGLSGPLSTCRFRTRIDYVYLSGEFFAGGRCCPEWTAVDALTHADDRASDHNLVLAEISVKVNKSPEVKK